MKRLAFSLIACALLVLLGARIQFAGFASFGGITGGIGGIGTNSSGSDNIFNALNFGAKGDSTTDDTGALQYAYNSSAAAGANQIVSEMFIPVGQYKTTFPLLFTWSGSQQRFPKVMGAGPQQSLIAASGVFPPIIIVPNDYTSSLGTISVPPIVGATGNALQFNSGAPYFLLFNEVPMVGTGANAPTPMNGLSAFTIQFFFTTSAVSGTEYLVDSGNQDLGLSEHLAMSFVVGGAATAKLTTSGGAKTITGGTVAANTTYWVALSYTGSNLYLYLAAPGAAGQSPVASTAQTGTVVQPVTEAFQFGGQAQAWPPWALSNPFKGTVQSIDIEKTAVYSGGAVTAPNANFSGGANTLYLNNFTTITPADHATSGSHYTTPVVSVDYLNGASQSNAWQLLWNPTYDGNARGITMSDLSTSNGTVGVFWSMAPLSNIANINVSQSSYMGVVAFNNTYDSRLDDIQTSTSTNGASAFVCSWAIGIATDILATGSRYPISTSRSGCGMLVDPIETGSSSSVSGIITDLQASGFSTNAIYGNLSDIESGGNVNGLELYGNAGFLELHGGSYAASGTGVPIQIDGTAVPVSMYGGYLAGSGTSAYAIHFSDNTATNKVTIVGALWAAATTGFSNSSATSIVQYEAPPSKFANLGTEQNGERMFCSDCAVGNPCAGGGTGAWADGINGVWVCVN